MGGRKSTYLRLSMWRPQQARVVSFFLRHFQKHHYHQQNCIECSQYCRLVQRTCAQQRKVQPLPSSKLQSRAESRHDIKKRGSKSIQYMNQNTTQRDFDYLWVHLPPAPEGERLLWENTCKEVVFFFFFKKSLKIRPVNWEKEGYSKSCKYFKLELLDFCLLKYIMRIKVHRTLWCVCVCLCVLYIEHLLFWF